MRIKNTNFKAHENMLWKNIGKYSKQTSGWEKNGTKNRLAKEKYLNIISLYHDSL